MRKPYFRLMVASTLAVLVLGLVLVACQPAATPTTEAAPTDTPPPPVKILYWSHDFPPRADLDREYMDKFKADNPGVEIEYVIGPGNDSEYITKLVTALAGGEGPDCFTLLSMAAAPLLAQGSVIPLDYKLLGYDSQEALETSYVEGTLEGLKYNGTLYAIPNEVSIYSLFLNKKLFEDAGLDPAADYPKTWEDLRPLAEKLNLVEGGQLKQRAFDFTYGMPDDITSPVLTLAGMAYQLGGTVVNAEGTEATVNTEPWVRTFQFVQDWVYQDKFGDPALTVSNIGFYEGTVAMTISGSWFSSYIKDQQSPVYDTHTVVPLPRWSDATNPTGAFMYSYGIFINAASSPEKQQVCQGLIKELSAHPERYLTDAGLLQPTLALSQSSTIQEVPNMQVFLNDMVGTPYWLVHTETFAIADAIGRALQRVVTENQPVQEALDQAKSEIDELLK